MATKKENLNMRHWDKSKTVPESAKKPIEAGRLRGFTSVNPVWLLEKTTELFGPCGIGWTLRYEEQPLAVNEVTGEKTVRINCFVKYKDGDTWSDELPGFGSAKYVAREKNGLYTDDDAWKKAATDARGNALLLLGEAAGIRYNSNEDNKYVAPTPEPVAPLAPVKPIPPKLKSEETITQAQAEHLETIIDRHQKQIPDMLAYINGQEERVNNPADDLNQLTYKEYSDVVGMFKE